MARDFTANAANYYNIGDVAAIDITGTDVTIAAWAFPDDSSSARTIAGKWIGGAGTRQYVLGIDTNKATFLTGDASTFSQATGATTVSTSAWQHYCGRQNSSGLAVFLNGASDGTNGTARTMPNTTSSFRISQRGDASVLFDGRIAEVCVWDVPLTDAEIAALAKGASPLLIRPGSLKGYWPLWGATSTEPDLSGNANNATLNGTVNAFNHSPTGRMTPTSTGARGAFVSAVTFERSAALDAVAAITANGGIVHDAAAAIGAAAAIAVSGRNVVQPTGVSFAFGQPVLEPYPTWTRIDA